MFDESSLRALGAFLGIFLVLVIIIGIFYLITNIKLFQKAKKPGWAAIVPIYNYWVLTEIAGLEWWWFLLMISNIIVSVLRINALSTVANIAQFIAMLNCYYNIAMKFHKDKNFAICAGIFRFIFAPILAFSKDCVYDADVLVSSNGLFGKVNDTNINNNSYMSNQNMNNGYNNYGQGQSVGNTVNMNNDYNNYGQVQNVGDINSMNNNYAQSQNINNSPKFCTSCGAVLKDNVNFCDNCGAKVVR